MTLPFLVVFPREIRDQIYTYVLASPSGAVSLSPWTVEVARSLSLLRTCKQIQRECKAIIWGHNALNLHFPTKLSQKLTRLALRNKRIQHIKVYLEILDHDELEWVTASLQGLSSWTRTGSLASITIIAMKERPRTVEEFHEALSLRYWGEVVDGRLYEESKNATEIVINTGWPRFSHWGKQNWLRTMLLDPSGVSELLNEMHESFGGELHLNGELAFKDRVKYVKEVNMDLRDAEIQILPRKGPTRHISYSRQ